MDVKKLLENISDLVECNICFEVYSDPRKLACDHHYCLKCLKGIVRKHRNKLPCPDCRCETDLEDEEVESLPKAFHVNSLLDVFHIKESEGTPVKCQTCEQVSNSSSYCFRCSEFLCQICTNAHCLVKQTRSHRVLILSEINDSDIQTILERPAYCNKHKDELVKLFCLGCKVSICQICAVTKHAAHTLEDIEETTERFKGHVKERIRHLEGKLEEVSKAKRAMQEEIDVIRLSKVRVEEEIKCALKKIEECFRKKIMEINAAEENACKAVHEQMNRACAMEEHITKEIRAMTSALSAVVPGNIGQDSAEQDNKVKKICSAPTEQVNKVIIGYQPSMEIEQILKEENVGQIIHQPAAATVPLNCTAEGQGLTGLLVGIASEISVYTNDSKHQRTYCFEDKVAVGIKSRDGEFTEMVAAVTDSKTGKYDFVFTPSAKREYEISVKVNEEAIPGSPFCVKASERQFKTVKCFGREGSSDAEFIFLWGLSASRDGHIAVCDRDNKRIQVFDTNGKLVVPAFGMDVLSTPITALYLNDAENHILVSDFDKGVTMFTSTGLFVRTFCETGSKDGEVKNPTGLCLDEKGNVIVCDNGNNRIQVLLPKGEFIRSFGSKEMIPVFCAYSKGNYYVTDDQDTNSVHVFNDSGQWVNEFRNDNSSSWYCGVVVTEMGHVIVSDCMEHNLAIYQNGALVKKIGSRGIEPGNFFHPVGITLLPDGRLAVVDAGNHRIQILE